MATTVYTLLEIVNSVLMDIGRDRVNDLGQTPDAIRVEEFAKNIFYLFVTRKDWPNKRELVPLESVSDLTRRTCLKIPDHVDRVEELKYNLGTPEEPNWKNLIYVYPEEFSNRMMDRKSADVDEYITTTIDGISMYIFSGADPTYWTSFDDELIILDSYDRTKEDTVQGHKVAAWVYTTPAWPLTKDDKIPLPNKFFPAYLSLLKATAWEKIKKEPNNSDLYWGRANMARFLHEEKVVGKNQAVKRRKYGRRRPC